MLLNKFTRLALGTITLIGFTACGSKDNSVMSFGNGVNVAAIMNDAHLSNEEKAEELSKAAQLLVTPTSFMYASSVADASLRLDSKNPRARFIKGLLGPVMELKGIVHRIAPLVTAHPQFAKGYEQLYRDLKKADPQIQAFMMNGPFDIATEADAQEFIARVTLRYDEFRRTLSDLKDSEFTLTANIDAFRAGSAAEASARCHVTQQAEGVYDLSGCPSTSTVSRKVNRADFEMMKQQVAGLQVYTTVLNGYDLSGVLEASESGNRDPKGALEKPLENKNFLTLRTNSGFGAMPDLAKDAVLGARWALEKQNELCPNGPRSKMNRPGYLFEEGLCVESSGRAVQILALIESVAAGNAVQLPAHGEMQKVTVAPMKFFTAPIQDLRSQMPIQTNECGKVTAIGNGKFGEVFPTEDLNHILLASAKCK